MGTLRRTETCSLPEKKKELRSHKSKLLSEEENLFIHSLLKRECMSLLTTVVELYLTHPPHHDTWVKEATGVLCFVKNTMCQKHRFYLYSLDQGVELWQTPVNKQIDYWADMTFFHMFKTEKCVVGFNFAETQEAAYFKNAVKIELQSIEIDSKFVISKPPMRAHTTKAVRKKVRAKLDISSPHNFVHVAHVNLSMNGSSFNTGEDNIIAEIFKLAGVTKEQMQDEETRKFMEGYVKKKTSSKKNRAPPPPQQQKQLLFVPPPSCNQPTSPSRKAPPLPPPAPPGKRQTVMAPPPPPLPQFSNDDEISTSFNTPEPPAISDPRANLLESIRKGSTLRSVKEREIPRVDEADFYKNDIAAALSKAIRMRDAAIRNNEPYSDSEFDDDDDEWDC